MLVSGRVGGVGAESVGVGVLLGRMSSRRGCVGRDSVWLAREEIVGQVRILERQL